MEGVTPSSIIGKWVRVYYKTDDMTLAQWIQVCSAEKGGKLIGVLDSDCKHVNRRKGAKVQFSFNMIHCVWDTELMLKT